MRTFDETVMTSCGPARLHVVRLPSIWHAVLWNDAEHFVSVEQLLMGDDMTDSDFLIHVQTVFRNAAEITYWPLSDLDLDAEPKGRA